MALKGSARVFATILAERKNDVRIALHLLRDSPCYSVAVGLISAMPSLHQRIRPESAGLQMESAAALQISVARLNVLPHFSLDLRQDLLGNSTLSRVRARYNLMGSRSFFHLSSSPGGPVLSPESARECPTEAVGPETRSAKGPSPARALVEGGFSP